MDISGAIDEYLAAKKPAITAKTYRWYCYHLDRFLAFCQGKGLTDLSKVNAAVVNAALEEYSQVAPSPNSRHGYVQVVKGFLSWCSLDEDFGVRERTVKRIELPRLVQSEVRIFTEEEIDKLLWSCTREPYPYRAKALVHILLDTGIRASELCWDASRPQEETGLRMEYVFLGREDSHIRVMGKGRKARIVGMGNETSKALRKYLHKERGPDDNPYVFLTRAGEPMRVRLLEKIVTDIGDRAGIPGCHPHLFRHTFAVNCLLNGVSDMVLMKLMGHTSLEATKIYVRAMSEIQAMKTAPSIVDILRQPKKRE